MGQIKFLTSLVLISLFVVAMLTFAINFASDNSASISLADDSDYPGIQSNLEDNVETFYSDMGTATNATYQSTISSQTEATEGGTAFKVGPGTALLMAKNSITAGYTKLFGPEFGIFLTAFLSLLGLISLLYIYKTWAGRNPD